MEENKTLQKALIFMWIDIPETDNKRVTIIVVIFFFACISWCLAVISVHVPGVLNIYY